MGLLVASLAVHRGLLAVSSRQIVSQVR